jgi:twinkle protein
MSFIDSRTTAFSEMDGRKNRRDGLLSFGIDYLDDAMVGILKNDLVLIGAGSGAGKTQLCCNIALSNIARGKRVHFIALEAEMYEIERRLKYSLFAKQFFADPNKPKHCSVSFQNWMLGDFLEGLAKYEAEACSEFIDKYGGLFTFYKQDKFGISDLIAKTVECADETDLIIVDHVHYFDFDDDNENRAVKEIAKTARMLTLEQGKPIILVSHLRKRDRGSFDLVPGLEEFHGSSDLYKIATKAITIAPGKWSPEGKYQTFFRIVKNRFEGSVTRTIGAVNYLTKEGRYESGYKIGDANCKRDGGFVELDFSHEPAWARNIKRGGGSDSVDNIKRAEIPKYARGTPSARFGKDED